MPLWSIVAILALTCAQCSSVEGATLKIGMMPYTFEPIIRYDPTKPPPNLEPPIDGLYKRFWEAVIQDVYGYDSVQFVPVMEYMTLQDTIGFLTPHLRSGAIDVAWSPDASGPQRPEFDDMVYVPGLARTNFAVLGRKEIKQNNLMQFVTPLSGEVWGMLAASVVMGGFVIFALMFAEKHNVGRKEAAWSMYESFAALLGAESIESKYISIVMSSPLGRLFRIALLFLVLIVTATYTANLAAFLTAPTTVLHGPQTVDELRNARVCIRSQPIANLIIPHIGFNVENGMSVVDNADPVKTAEWTERALMSGECDAIADMEDMARMRLLAECDKFHMPDGIRVGEYSAYHIMRGGAGERGLVENVTAAILRHLPSTERIDYYKDITGKGRTCPKTDYGTQTVTLVSLGGVFIVFFSISFVVLVAALAKGFMDKKDNNNSKAIATLQDSAMKVAGDVRMRTAFEEIARLVEAVKNIPDFAA